MKISSTEGKALLDKLGQAVKGKPLDLGLPSLLPALGEKVQAVCTETQKGKYWEFALYWCGINVGKVCAEVQGDTLRMEQL